MRNDIKISPPPQGWDFLMFIDGYTAQIVGATEEKGHDGLTYTKFVLMPHPDLCKRYNITRDMLDENLTLIRSFPKDYIKTLNEDDPARKIRFCLVNFNGKKTSATDFFEGTKFIEEGLKLRKDLERKEMRIAVLTEENHLARTNVQKYLKQTMGEFYSEIVGIIGKAGLSTDKKQNIVLGEGYG